jgi:hypothetical protein
MVQPPETRKIWAPACVGMVKEGGTHTRAQKSTFAYPEEGGKAG